MKNRIRHTPSRRRRLPQASREPSNRSRSYILPIRHKKILQSLSWAEERMEILLDWLKGLAFLEILQLLGNLSILFAAIIFFTSGQQQRDTEVYQAWQVITAAHDQPGSGGRVKALEFLNSEPRRNPWFWLNWPRESLAGLAARDAYLKGVKLSGAILEEAFLQKAKLMEADLKEANLRKASMWGADLQKANLQEANLQEAYLRNANLRDANLTKANLTNAGLEGADLSGANLSGASLRGAVYSDDRDEESKCKEFKIPHPCPTKFPDGFDPQAAGMVLNRNKH